MAIAGIGAAVAIAGIAASAIGAAADAKAQKEALKAKRDADIKVLRAETKAGLESLTADTEAQSLVIESESRARIKAALYEADSEGQNIGIAELLRKDALNRGLLDEFAFRRTASQAQGTQRARLAGSGVDINSGSAAFLQEELIVATDLDALSIQQNAAREGYGFKLEAYAAGRRRDLGLLEATSTAEVAAANIKGVRDVAQVRAKGIRQTAKVNEKAIRSSYAAGGPSIGRSAGLAALNTGTQFAASWYLSGKGG